MGLSPIRDMFNALVPEYDRFNRLSSWGLDSLWRRDVAKIFEKGSFVLDVGTGTGDLANAVAGRGCRVVGVDFSENMVMAARKKFGNRSRMAFEVAEADKLPFASTSFDGVSSAFVIRNLNHAGILSQSFREFNRVLKMSGRMAHLELTRPPRGLMSRGHRVYLGRVLPVIGKAVFGHRWPDDYLSKTIQDFHSPQALCQMMRWAGFDRVSHYALCGGIAGIFTGVKC